MQIPQIINFELYADLAIAAISEIATTSIGGMIAFGLLLRGMPWLITSMGFGPKSWIEQYSEADKSGDGSWQDMWDDPEARRGLMSEGYRYDSRKDEIVLRRGWEEGPDGRARRIPR